MCGVARGQSIHSISLDSVTGLSGPDTLYTSREIVFHLRMTYTADPSTNVTGIWNAFRVYSPTGAEWVSTSGDYTDAITESMLHYQVTVSRSTTGSGADTVGFAAETGFLSCGVPNMFNEVAWTLTVGPIDTTFVGHVLCLDSAMYIEPVVTFEAWNWKLGFCDWVEGNVAPEWDGPHCFNIANPPCEIVSTGDVNLDAALNSADIIRIVNFIFRGGEEPMPCVAAGDVNCNGQVTSSDVIVVVNYVFKGGQPPCNVCGLIWNGVWNCP